MKKILLLYAVLTVLISCGSVKKYNQQITKLHAVVDLHSDINKLYKQLQKHHPKLYQYTPKPVLDFKFDSLKTTITKPITSRDFYKKLAPVLAHVRQGHVSVGSVIKQFTKKERRVLKDEKFEFYDLDFEYLDHKLWVEDYRGEDSTLIGNEVMRIADEDASLLAETYKTRFASDGFNTTLHDRFVSKGFNIFYLRDKGFLDSLKITFKVKDSLFDKVFRRISKTEKNDSLAVNDTDLVKHEKPKKLTKEQKLEIRLAKRKKRKDHKKYGYLSKRHEYIRNFEFIGQDSTVGYMKLRSFTDGHYKTFYKESFAKLDSAKTKNFILDLRDNGGGRIAEIDYLYSFLTAVDYQFITESEVNSRIPFLKAFMANTTPNSLKITAAIFSPIVIVHNLLKTKKRDGKLYYRFNKHSKIKVPNPLNYKGKMYVLINGNSFSASSLLSTHLKATNRAIFVGEETGGAYNGTVAGIYKIYELPITKLNVRMGLMHIEAPQKQAPDGYGIRPDIEITPNFLDRNTKHDPELEWVLDTIDKN